MPKPKNEATMIKKQFRIEEGSPTHNILEEFAAKFRKKVESEGKKYSDSQMLNAFIEEFRKMSLSKAPLTKKEGQIMSLIRKNFEEKGKEDGE